jgi:protein-tyrosine kinase
MSRIHEALKKAEKERASILSNNDLAPPPRSPAQPPPRSTGSARSATIIRPETEVIEPQQSVEALYPSGFLQFEDIWKRCAQPGWNVDPSQSAFASPDAPVSITEQFRTLRSRLYQIRDKQPLATLLVTSALPAEGKTFIASNLAQAMVRQQDKRVLLIDADLRCSRLHHTLGAPVSPGLSDYLMNKADELTVIQRGVPEHLCMIAGGSNAPNPSELLQNGRFKLLLDRLQSAFDWIIIDSPPTIPVSDSLLLADMCDGVLMVVRAAYTAYDAAQKSCQEFHGKNLLGVVLNRAEDTKAYGAYYYHYYGSKEPEKG